MATSPDTQAFEVGRNGYIINPLAYRGILDEPAQSFRLQFAVLDSQVWNDWLTVDALGNVTIPSLAAGTTIPWTSITGTPTTLAGYGITSPLPVAEGGTGTATPFTAGSVVFAGASGVYSQDNANLFWDDTTNRLGIGTTTPLLQLEVRNGMLLPGGTQFVLGGSLGTLSRFAMMFNDTGQNDMTFRTYRDYFFETDTGDNTAGTKRLAIKGATGNVLIGTTTQPSTGSASLVFGDGTAPASMASNTAGLYADDVAGTVKMFVIDEAGVTGQIATISGGSTEAQPLDPTLTSLAALADAAGVLTNDGAGVLSWTVPPGTGTVTGTGTTGTIPKWTSASALGDSIITEAAGALSVAGVIGIGGAASSAILHVFNAATTNPIARFDRDANTTSGSLQFRTGVTIDWGIGLRATSDSDFHIFNFGTSLDVLTAGRSSGNVGIGTTTPSTVSGVDLSAQRVLHVQGSANARVVVTAGAVAANLDLIDSSAGANVKWGNLASVGGTLRLRAFSDAGAATFTLLNADLSTGHVTFNDTVNITAADGIADNAYVADFRNMEATAGRSFGLFVQAGSDATDTVFFLRNVPGTDLLRVSGSGTLAWGGGAAISSSGNVALLNAANVFTQGLYASGFVGAPSGSNLELGYAGGGIVQAYNRTGAVYTDLILSGLTVTFRANGTDRFKINTAGDWLFGSNIMDSVGTPTIASGFGTGATIEGTDYAFRVNTSGLNVSAGGVVNFGHTFTTAPICVASHQTPAAGAVTLVATTTTVTIAHTSTLGPVFVLCRGY